MTLQIIIWSSLLHLRGRLCPMTSLRLKLTRIIWVGCTLKLLDVVSLIVERGARIIWIFRDCFKSQITIKEEEPISVYDVTNSHLCLCCYKKSILKIAELQFLCLFSFRGQVVGSFCSLLPNSHDHPLLLICRCWWRVHEQLAII